MSNNLRISYMGFFVYILFDGDMAVYVGQTTNLVSRIHYHYKNTCNFDSYEVINVSNKKHMDAIEFINIVKYSPPHNKNKPRVPFLLCEQQARKLKRTSLEYSYLDLSNPDYSFKLNNGYKKYWVSLSLSSYLKELDKAVYYSRSLAIKQIKHNTKQIIGEGEK